MNKLILVVYCDTCDAITSAQKEGIWADVMFARLAVKRQGWQLDERGNALCPACLAAIAAAKPKRKSKQSLENP